MSLIKYQPKTHVIMGIGCVVRARLLHQLNTGVALASFMQQDSVVEACLVKLRVRVQNEAEQFRGFFQIFAGVKVLRNFCGLRNGQCARGLSKHRREIHNRLAALGNFWAHAAILGFTAAATRAWIILILGAHDFCVER